MKNSYAILIVLLAYTTGLFGQYQPPKVYLENKTLTYQELIEEYKKLDASSSITKLIEYKKTDSGFPLHLLVISDSKTFEPKDVEKKDLRVVLINNGIHPGEPAGMEASLQLASQLISKDSEISQVLKNTVVCIIPAYNIGGMLNRSPYNRANQNGPEACGFRGNARNLDLNRDFMLCRSENAEAFTKIFHDWKPDVFLDTHTTDGSDHQYAITLITTAHQDLPPSLGTFLNNKMEPDLYKRMEAKSSYKMIPYVHVWRKPPDENGFQQTFESPRLSTGYTSLFNTLSFMTENHIFKSFKDRVLSCLDFEHCLLQFTSDNAEEIKSVRKTANQELKTQKEFALDWKLDSSQFEMIKFDGYTATYPPSKLTGEPLLYYDREKPFSKEIKYYNGFNPTITKTAPVYYIIPQAWKEVIKRLKWNSVKMHRLTENITLNVDMYYIEDYKTYDKPYNGNYAHYGVKTSTKTMEVTLYSGDYVVPVKGKEKYYLMHALEPESPNSFFAWNMFDEILQSREYFSPFVFEEKAITLLDTIPELKEKLANEIMEHPDMAKNAYKQMLFIYRNSPYFEPTFKRYPVGRIYSEIELPIK